jgi:S-adenosylmethionine synthetase
MVAGQQSFQRSVGYSSSATKSQQISEKIVERFQGRYIMTAEDLAKLFHETYERLAPEYGYRTREASVVSWEQVPEQNKKLMIATCDYVLKRLETYEEGTL